MRRPHLSTGAWIFASVVAAAVIAPTAVYAAATSTVAIGNTSGNTTATVTPDHQLLTTTIAPKSVVHARGFAQNGCANVYIPPAGKAIVVTSVTYNLFGNASGTENLAVLMSEGCVIGLYDTVDTAEAFMTEMHTFPIGLPMPSVAIYSGVAAWSIAYITGYLIPASQLPATAPSARLPASLAHPTH